MASASSAALVAPGVTNVGFIGTGIMGGSMCGHILAKGYATTVTTRTPAKADALVASGAVFAATPREVAAASDVVFVIVGFPADVREVILGDNGVLAGLRPGCVVVDCTTSEPGLSKEVYAAAAAQGCSALDCPVSGGDAGARAATLTLMLGGDEAVVQRVAPLLRCLGTPHFMGAAGAGQSTKAANQIAICTTSACRLTLRIACSSRVQSPRAVIGLVESLLFAHASGLDPDRFLTAIRGGAAGSRSLELYAPRLRSGDMAPGFFVKHFIKDLGVALDECRRLKLALPGLALAHQLYTALAAQGDEELGTQALIRVLERLNNVTVPTKAA
jgi:3-hydroxyisobutyrate dehydrogenase